MEGKLPEVTYSLDADKSGFTIWLGLGCKRSGSTIPGDTVIYPSLLGCITWAGKLPIKIKV